MMMPFLESPLIGLLAILTSIVFTAIAALVPPNAGNFVGGLFVATLAAFLGGEDKPDQHDLELEDADI